MNTLNINVTSDVAKELKGCNVLCVSVAELRFIKQEDSHPYIPTFWEEVFYYAPRLIGMMFLLLVPIVLLSCWLASLLP